MRCVIEIPTKEAPKAENRMRVAAYCRVSTQREQQDSSIDLQILHYKDIIDQNPNWINAGIFSDRSSGIKKTRRTQFIAMMKQCRAKKIDLILTKSISRFGRNTLTSLIALRELDSIGIDVFFENENLWLHQKEMQILITMYLAVAQSESESMSRNIKWGIRQGFRNGTSGYAGFTCYGYVCGTEGSLQIHEDEAEVVREIFLMRASGQSLGRISDWLHENAVVSPTGRERWSRETISKLLCNEKYVGDVLLQKTYVKDIFTGKQVKNEGKLDKVLIHNHHPAIISRELFDCVNNKP